MLEIEQPTGTESPLTTLTSFPLRAATFFGWIVASTWGAPATHKHFLLLSNPFAPAGRFTPSDDSIPYNGPTSLARSRSLTDTSRRSGNTPSLILCT
jgi:hypothetical protein